MSSSANSLALFFAAVASISRGTSILRWQIAAIAIGIVVVSFGLAGMTLFFFRRKTGDRSLIYFSSFSLLYGIRLIFRQSLFQHLLPVPGSFWNYSDAVIDNFIVLPLTLFLIEIVQDYWKKLLRWVLAFQIVFAITRCLLQIFRIGGRPRETVYHLVIVAYCSLLFVYPFWLARRGLRLPREWKVFFAGLTVFGLFVIYSNILGLALINNRDFEPIGFLVLICCLGYVTAFRTYANEQHLLAIQKELEIARQIQSSILPREVPRLSGLEIAARYLPMAAVAGDFYDFLIVDEKRAGILVADVTGHGVPAALIASMLKIALAAQAPHAAEPAQVLTGLNHALCGKFEEHFVTAGYLFVDSEKRRLRYAGAGHPPLLFGSTHGRKEIAFREIESNGLLLDVAEDASYCSVELSFGPGDRCVLYTDGIVEAKNAAQEEFGAERFLKFLEAQPNLAAELLITASLDELARWSGKGASAAREDDITLVAVDFARDQL